MVYRIFLKDGPWVNKGWEPLVYTENIIDSLLVRFTLEQYDSAHGAKHLWLFKEKVLLYYS